MAGRRTVRGMGQSADQAISIGWLNVQSLRNKTDAVEELVRDRSLDVLALTETWHTDSDDICLRLATPEGYAIAEVARPPGRAGGGVAIIFNKSLKCSRVPVPASSTFDTICVRLTSAREQVAIRGVYRPVIYQCHSYEPISPPVILPTSITTCTINESSQLKLQLVVDCGQLATRHWTRPPQYRHPAYWSFPSGNNRIPQNVTTIYYT